MPGNFLLESVPSQLCLLSPSSLCRLFHPSEKGPSMFCRVFISYMSLLLVLTPRKKGGHCTA